MGKQISVIKFSGKVGGLVGAVNPLGGAPILRAMPMRTEKKATEAQILQRCIFGTLGCLAESFGKSIIGLNQYAKSKKMRNKNAFVHLNKDKVQADSPSIVNVAFDELILSKGSAVGVSFTQPDLSERDAVTLPFTTSSSVAANSRVIGVVYQADLGKAVSAEGTAQAGSVQVAVPRDWSGMRAHMFGYTLNFTSDTDAAKFDAIYSVSGDVVTAALVAAASMATPSDSTYIGTGTLS